MAMRHTPYLPILLIWALPVVALQWLIGWRYLWRERRRWPWIVVGLGVYFWLADAVAIEAGIWSFDPRSLSGLYLGPVPIEEVLFYLLTAAMVVQGFVLFQAAFTDRVALQARVTRRIETLQRLFGRWSTRPPAKGSPPSSAPPTVNGDTHPPNRLRFGRNALNDGRRVAGI